MWKFSPVVSLAVGVALIAFVAAVSIAIMWLTEPAGDDDDWPDEQP